MYLSQLVFVFLLALYPGVEFWDPRVTLFFVLGGTSMLFSMVAATSFHSNQPCTSFRFSPHPLLLFVICRLFWWWPCGQVWSDYHIVVLIGFSLLIRRVEHLFMCLLAICMSSLGKKKSVQLFCWFLDWVVSLFILIFILYWRTVDLQSGVSFKCTAKGFSYTYTYNHSF